MDNIAGKLANVVGKVCSRRLTRTAKNTLTPFYGVKIGGGAHRYVNFLTPPSAKRME